MTQSRTGGPAGPDGGHADWLDACRRATTGLRLMLTEHPTTRERAEETGSRGEGGDLTLVIDEAAEDLVFAELDRLHAAGRGFVAISEERGEVDYGDPAVRVVIDPIDGSLNAKRGLAHHCLSVAVAEGDTMADVVFGYVHDLGADEEWVASRGAGAYRGGRILDAALGERRADGGKLEVLGIESADPRWVAEAADDLRDSAHRLRALGSIAISLCQVAAARFDGMVTLKRCRSVDAAAGQLIVREGGGLIAFTGYEDPLAAPLDLVPRSPVIAARTERALTALRALPRA
jgi:myo-inositol-1(or 4)-monophosphatase